ncbi:calcium/calmodulin-dependent protein kinase type II subunit gamma [Mayamaea pseudoterrestris]|nr:calcium/calmodulin-dependent protein kinase type II subunit gamma [Mayamaea pseudoterrestris]
MPTPDLIALTHELLLAIEAKDLHKYKTLVDDSITCFEPEAEGYLVEGIAFHEYYFQFAADRSSRNTTMVRPHVRMLGSDAGVVSYVRLTQKIDPSSKAATTSYAEETRVWQCIDGQWKNVHFHRSIPE